MRGTTFLLTALPALVSGHGDDFSAGLPKIMGGSNFLRNLKSRNVFTEAMGSIPSVVEARSPEAEDHLEARQTVTTCGAGVGSCQTGYCCSAAGYCGTGSEYCTAPDCQFQYGPACDANIVPAGASTSSVARTHLGSIPYGGDNTAGVQDCINTGEMALTFDDGPYLYTKDLLDLLDRYNAKATFFITGNNLGKGEIDNCSTGYPELIQRMHASGHQVASHTWSHQNFTALTETQFHDQVYYNEMAFRNILGFFPTYLRPPYSECNSQCSSWLSTLGYHATYFDLDTSDYLNDSPTLIQNSKNIFTGAIAEYGSGGPSQSNFLVIGHDIHYQTVYNLTQFMLDTMAADGYGTSVTVGQCLGDPAANWYRSAGNATVTCSYVPSTSASTTATATSSTSSTKSTLVVKVGSSTSSSASTPSSTLAVSADGSCGGTTGETCQGSTYGNCCSQSGYCGSTSAYCGTSCQSAFGSCGISSSSYSSFSSSSSSSLSSTKPASSTISSTISSSGNNKQVVTSSSSTKSSSSTTSSAKSTATATLKVSTDGNCGGTSGETCSGSTYGNCCSRYGYCGKSSAYCGTGCQKGFGSGCSL